MDFHIINAVVLSLFVTWFIPNSIRNPKTGEYLGFANKSAAIQIGFLIAFETYLLLGEFEVEPLTFARIAFSVSLTVALAFVYVVVSQKKLFGNEFRLNPKQRNGS